MNLNLERRTTQLVNVAVPTEILSCICKELVFGIDDKNPPGNGNRDDIKSFRLVCRDFNRVASPFLISTVRFALERASLHRIIRISNHAVFSNTVTRLFFHARLFNYAVAVNGERFYNQSQLAYRRLSLDGIMTNLTELQSQYHEYCKAYVEQERCLTNPFHELLGEALIRMPHLKTVTVTMDPIPDKRAMEALTDIGMLDRVEDHYPLQPDTFVNIRLNDDAALVVDNVTHNTKLRRQLHRFLSTIAGCLTSLRSIGVVFPAATRDAWGSTLPDLMPPIHSDLAWKGLFRHCQTIDLTILLCKDGRIGYTSPTINDWTKMMREALAGVLNLVSLRLAMRGMAYHCGFRFYSSIASVESFPMLKELRLENLGCQIDFFQRFMMAHRGTLKRLSFTNTHWDTTNGWPIFIEFAKVLNLGLTECNLENINLRSVSRTPRWAYFKDSDSVVAWLNKKTLEFPVVMEVGVGDFQGLSLESFQNSLAMQGGSSTSNDDTNVP